MAAVDPLSGLSGLSLFPRTIRASADAPLPADPKDLDSIHNIMKSLKEVRSPEKLMSEAKKIVDGGADLLSNISSFAGNVGVTNEIAAKAKDRPQERRQGLGLARKKASFSLKTSISHPPVNLEPTLDIDQLQDPDVFFDAVERNENAKKEIQKQLGVGKDNIDLYKPLNNERRRRPGILGHRKSFDFKHRYSSTPYENDDMLMSSQETVYEDIPSSPKDASPEKLIDPDPNLEDLEEVEMAESMKKTESQVSDMLEELLSYNDDDLEGQGALKLLQERLKIKTLGTEKLYHSTDLLDIGRTNILTSPGSSQKPRKSSTALDSMLKNFNKKPRTEQELLENPANPVSSPTPPRNPFGSISLLKKKILHPNPLRDPYSPDDIDLCDSSPVHPMDKLLGQVDTPKELDMSNELESHVEWGHTEPLISEMNSQKVMGDADSLPEQSRDESNPSVVDEEARDVASPRRQTDSEMQELQAAKWQRGKKVAGAKRIRDAHPMRKSLAEAGTSFENGLRRSKRVRMRPLEYWKGERFLYGRVGESLKLIGLKYISPGKGDEKLKVKPYKDSLDQASPL